MVKVVCGKLVCAAFTP
ncbi:hypothetical protein QO219_21840 [Vibrio vulnificus]|nr:hypothetical protein [Vibrio vulnificus]MCU8177478.1 hypothetical protein [Vibrio vulnificus]MCU8300320.1 hypothetical protein [Vibrio vulnificus]MCU8317649.1 hypothetical protein [Vibrio vulnificus]MDK2683895.1 hypothetical protein [Vibrio vulnificus]MDS1873126.1 hypothetical protein [Vibrio vulnificus]